MEKRTNLTGYNFGHLTVIGPYRGVKPCRGVYWDCLCECGNRILVTVGKLTGGFIKHCGCMVKEGSTLNGKRHSPEYEIRRNFLQRCYNKNNPFYPQYGGRGICVFEPWRTSFINFLNDMGPRPGPEYSLDRIDNDGNYEPGNCRWATIATQMSNTSRNIFHTRNGESIHESELVRRVGISAQVLRDRLSKGLTIEEALQPVGGLYRKYEINGQQISIREAAEKYGIEYATLHHRIKTLKLPIDVAVKFKPKSGWASKLYSGCGESKTLSQWSKVLNVRIDRLYEYLVDRKMSVEEVMEMSENLK